MKYHYLYRFFAYIVTRDRPSGVLFSVPPGAIWEQLCDKQSQVGSLAGAAHLLNNNAGVQGELNENRNLM